VLQKIW